MCHHLLIQVIFEIMTYYFNPLWAIQLLNTVIEYGTCVATNPRNPDPICPTDPISNAWYLHFYFLARSLSLIFFCCYCYVTNYYYRLWWRILLTKGRIATDQDLTFNSSSIISKVPNASV